jgi:hypothetical protein
MGTTTPVRRIRAPHLGPLELVRRIPGRNRTKADVVVARTRLGLVAIKDYGPRSWWLRNTLGRLALRRESAAYRLAGEVEGLPRFHGRVGPFALATQWIEARRLADCADGSVDAERFDTLRAIVERLHGRGVTLSDLSYRDVLLADDGAVFVVDLAMAWLCGERAGGLRRRIFERFRASDLFAIARLRARFARGDGSDPVADADRGAVSRHRFARRLKWRWDRLRGARRLPPVDDHWRFR